MNFSVLVNGIHKEGVEAKLRFEKIVKDFLDSLHVNGFMHDYVSATHDSDAVAPIIEVDLPPEQIPADGALIEVTPELAKKLNISEPETETQSEEAAMTVSFASAFAQKLAADSGMTDTDFAGIEQSGDHGYTADDVRQVLKAKA